MTRAERRREKFPKEWKGTAPGPGLNRAERRSTQWDRGPAQVPAGTGPWRKQK